MDVHKGRTVESTTVVSSQRAPSGARYALQGASRRMLLIAVVLICAMAFLGSWLAPLMVSGQPWVSIVAMVMAAGIGLPVLAVAHRGMGRLVRATNAAADARQRSIDDEGQHRDFQSKVADALDMVDSEDEALRVIERVLGAVVPEDPAELLLADNSHAHLTRMAFTAPSGSQSAGCGVASPHECPAARRSRIHYFPDSQAVNACPKLTDRAEACSALCIPVSVMGRAVGVIHTTSGVGAPLEASAQTDLQALANQAGARLGMLRIMSETQLQASTDGLTGLLNRRAFENHFTAARHGGAVSAVAMADLDHFKTLNDTYGHETGDRALRTFAQALRSCLRADDLVSRRGGEEFAVYFPGSDAAAAVAALHRVQLAFRSALAAAGLPECTASFGVVETALYEELETMLTRADAALFAAKHAGRDRVVVHDSTGRVSVDRTTPAQVESRVSLAPAAPGKGS